MRRLLTLLLLLLGVAGGTHAKSYKAEIYTTDLRILEDGSLAVTEVVRFRFVTGKFTHVWRTIPLRNIDGIEAIESPEPTRVRMRRGSVSVRWDFPASRDTVRTFTLSYRVRGALQLAGGGMALRWIAFPGDHTYRIERARVLLTWPEGWAAPERIEASRPRIAPIIRDAGALFEIGSLKPERTVLISANLAPGSLAAVAPAWQEKRERQRRQIPTMLAISGLILILGLGALLRMRRGAIAPASPERTVGLRATPPSELPAVLAGPICDGQVTVRHAVACLVDLGARGIVRFEAMPRTSRWTTPSHRLRRLETSVGLGGIERAVLESAFQKAGPDGTVELRKVWGSLTAGMKPFGRLVRAELESRGDFDPHVVDAGKGIARVGFLLFGAAAGVGLLVALTFDRSGHSAILPPVILAVLGTIAVGIGGSLPLQSASGRQRSLEWKGFARYLKDAAKGATPIDPARFALWLPYAMAFGLADGWLRAGKKWKITPPAWLQGLPGDDSGMAAWIPIFAASSAGHTGGVGGAAGGAGGGGGSGAG